MAGQNPQRPKHFKGLLARLRQLAADRRGVGAVEFALLAPLLLSLYITSLELTVGFSVSKRVTHSANTIADLVTRETSVNKAFLTTMDDVARSIFVPYTANALNIKVSGVTLDASGSPKVAWSWSDASTTAPYTVGSPVDVPTQMRIPNSFLIRAEVSVNHELLMFMPGLLPANVREITINREFFYAQRLGTGISCSDCS